MEGNDFYTNTYVCCMSTPLYVYVHLLPSLYLQNNGSVGKQARLGSLISGYKKFDLESTHLFKIKHWHKALGYKM